MENGKDARAKGARRRGRTRAFQALYGVSFLKEAEVRGLERLFTEAVITVEGELAGWGDLPAKTSLAWERDGEDWRLVKGAAGVEVDPAALLQRVLMQPRMDSALRVEFELKRTPVEGGDGELPEAAREFAWRLFSGVWRQRRELDETVARYSQHWKIERIARVELTILRLAIFEMLHAEDLPLKVAINEAVELSKAYGDENSRNFVNGILDGVARAVDAGEFGVTKKF